MCVCVCVLVCEGFREFHAILACVARGDAAPRLDAIVTPNSICADILLSKGQHVHPRVQSRPGYAAISGSRPEGDGEHQLDVTIGAVADERDKLSQIGLPQDRGLQSHPTASRAGEETVHGRLA